MEGLKSRHLASGDVKRDAASVQDNHIYTSGATGTNAAVIRGALRAEKPDLLTVVLPQSRSKQPPESQELLSEVWHCSNCFTGMRQASCRHHCSILKPTYECLSCAKNFGEKSVPPPRHVCLLPLPSASHRGGLLKCSALHLQVQNVIDMPANDKLSLFEASRWAHGHGPFTLLLLCRHRQLRISTIMPHCQGNALSLCRHFCSSCACML